MNVTPRDTIGDSLGLFINDTPMLRKFLIRRATAVINLLGHRLAVAGVLGAIGLGAGLYYAGVPTAKWIFPVAGVTAGVVAADIYFRVAKQPLLDRIVDPTVDVTEEEYKTVGV